MYKDNTFQEKMRSKEHQEIGAPSKQLGYHSLSLKITQTY